jgi:ASC-1-like (ASCH) protein
MSTTNKRHFLKTVWPYYDEVVAGRKKFELRLNDRNYKVGDHLVLMEWKIYYGEDAKKPELTGEMIEVRVTHVFSDGQFGIQPNFVVLSIELLPTTKKELHKIYQTQIETKKLRDHGINPEYLLGS